MPTDLRLDVRTIPPSERHPRIFALFASLRDDQALVLTSDHEPRPLRTEFERTHAMRFGWAQRQLGDGRWEVRLSKPSDAAAESAGEATLLRSVVFARADRSTLRDLAHYARRAPIKRHHCVVERGILWPYAGIVERGIVQAQLLTVAGREQAMYDVLPGELFAETALFDGGHVALRHVALTADTVVLLLPVRQVREAADRDPAVRRQLQETAAQHSRAILERFAAQLSLSATVRVAQALLSYAAPGMGLTEALVPLPTMTQVEIAASAGTVKEIVSRSLAELEALGAVRRDGGHIVALDRSKLADTIERG